MADNEHDDDLVDYDEEEVRQSKPQQSKYLFGGRRRRSTRCYVHILSLTRK